MRQLATRRPFALLLVLQGSQCESVASHFLSDIPIAEKVLAVLRSSLQRWDGRLYLLGGSEGGLLAAVLSARLSPVKTALLVTGGGFTMAEAMPSILRASMKEQGASADRIEQELNEWPVREADIRAHPDSLKTWFGAENTYRYWNSVLWVRPVEFMRQSTSQFLLIHGDRDTSHPVESARQCKNALPTITYWELKGLGHELRDAHGRSQMKETLNRALGWLFSSSGDRKTLSGGVGS